jgi:hypothetical protein
MDMNDLPDTFSGMCPDHSRGQSTKRRLLAVTFAIHLAMLTDTGHARSRSISWSIVSQKNLKVIVTHWLVEGYANQGQAVEAAAVNRKIPPRLSPRNDSALITRKLRLNRQIPEIGWWLLVLLIFVTPLIALLRHRRRITFRIVCLLGTSLGVAFPICVLFPSYSDFIWRGDRSYFGEYEYATGISWGGASTQNAEQTMIAYVKQPWHEGQRVVAYRDGNVKRISEDEFRRLVVKQGIFQNVD